MTLPTANSVTSMGVVRALLRSKGGVPKIAVEQPTVQITEEGLAGDWQLDRKEHGGPERALCLFSLEVIERLQLEGHPITVGAAGENITISGLDWSLLKANTQLLLGDHVLIEISRDAAPCKTIAHCFLNAEFVRISEKKHPGSSRMYAKVLRGGALSLGDSVRVVSPEQQA